ncbi:hypothetical protein BOSE62_40505 [Bosea sp. 62]|nr:hypothetical protein BOSE46_120279 [Bosea sp. 46]CAD5260966.1 hypothetical protein BOSE21B_110499 [Bosea sp. 21B]CAD5279666.1 hypothetical protein BOSE7B_40717 [Bosea sp. 7B]VVT58369.1 hypothetical protein BOS5A_200551 [Bosea sp. EC-HK365B]VXB52060.1 hypothetical protein BOSE29B_110444 [Bosea sp. 29B]VXB94558.1 hypothetical protein BOSE125_160236 [Bosea sp. 125]VXC46539.1 hypothetical protein BOSE62_40505 [Bosea sp. 62]VXC83395.1 hypothetical protein BOSE127_60115 [Bosea sp. 127]
MEFLRKYVKEDIVRNFNALP